MAEISTYTIAPPRGIVHLELKEIFRYRELLTTFVWRDIKVRYKQTVMGVAWAIFQPFATMIIFSVFFGGLAKVPSGDIPYPIFVYSGLIFWNYFSAALTNASNCLIENENIVKKIYFPRLILPLASVSTPVVDFMCAWIILILMMIYFSYQSGLENTLLMFPLLLLALVTAFGLGLIFASVNSKYRDVRYILPFFIQLLLFVTPVIFPTTLVPANFRWLLFLNPMTGVVELSRQIIFGATTVAPLHILLSIISAVFLLLVGTYYFKKSEAYFADLI